MADRLEEPSSASAARPAQTHPLAVLNFYERGIASDGNAYTFEDFFARNTHNATQNNTRSPKGQTRLPSQAYQPMIYNTPS